MTTQTQLSTFNFETHSIRVIAINNEPWFLSVDICNALNIANSRDAINKLDEDEYQTLNLKDTVGLTDSIANQVQSVGIVSESGMYTLILRCREAVKKGSVPHRFRKWVTAEVLPQIRKTGQYSQNSQPNLPLATAEKFIDIRICESDIRELAWIWFAGQQMRDFIGNLIRPLELLGSSEAPRAYSYANEYGNLLSGSIDLIEQLTQGVHFDNPTPLKRLKQAKEHREHRRKMVLNTREWVNGIKQH